METASVLVGVLLFIGLIIWLIFLPGILVTKKKTGEKQNSLYWTLATLVTGVSPGIIAALLYRYKDVSPRKAFTIGFLGFYGFSWAVAGVLLALGFDI